MCGICGIYGIEDKSLIKKMLLVLKHRGPDGQGVYTDTKISMGHARLSIIDLSERGRQPMSNENGEIWLSVNGEIYNFQELRASLEKEGHIFYSHSDSEVIIHAYEQYDLDFIKKLRGMFAFALYDTKKHRLILARDPIGKKPLYYYYKNNILIYASEIKGILETGIKKEIDFEALWIFLGYHYTFGEKTLFKNVKKVLPGEMLIIDDSKLTINQYWDIQETVLNCDETFFVKKLRTLLEESTKLRMIADVPIGGYLSGGIDSSAMVALARPFVQSEFHTFSAQFETFSELEYAKIVSEHVDTVHHEQMITAKMVIKDIPKIAWHYDEPLGDSGIVSNYYLAQDAKKYVTVIIAGEGGDELFAGYSNYLTNLKWMQFFRSHQSIRKILTYLPEPRINQYPNILSKISRYIKSYVSDSIETVHLNSERALRDDAIIDLTNLSPTNANSFAIYPKNVSSELGRMLALDCKNLLPEKFLMKSDKMTMANSLEGRMPLLDKNVIELSFCIPPNLKIKGNVEKYILRKAVEDLLPKKILFRKKQGFGTTTKDWMENELGEAVNQKISEGKLINEILKPEKRAGLLKNLDKELIQNQSKIWTLFVLEQWYDVFF